MRLLSYFLMLGCLSLFSSELFAITFVGGFEGNIWTDSRNWSPEQVPGAGEEADVPFGKSVNVNGDITVGTLILGGSLGNDGNPNSKLTITTSFSLNGGSVNCPVYLIQGCGSLWQGSSGINANVFNHGEITVSGNTTVNYATIKNEDDGIINLTGGFKFQIINNPAVLDNFGTLKRTGVGGGIFEILLGGHTNHPGAQTIVEDGELYASSLNNYAPINILGGAVFRTSGMQVNNGTSVTGGGTFISNGNGIVMNNTDLVTVSVSETEINSQGVKNSGPVTFTQHLIWKAGTMLAQVTFATGSVVDINPGGGKGITNTTTNNGTINVNDSFGFSTGRLDNYGTMNLNGAFSNYINNASEGIHNYGTVQKPVGSNGTYSMGVPLYNEPGSHLLVQQDELHINSNLYNSGEVIVNAGAILRSNFTETRNGGTFGGPGTFIVQNNGVNAVNTSPVSIDFAEIVLNAGIGGTGAVTLSGHVDWTQGDLAAPVTFASGSVVDMNPSGGHGISGTTTNNGTFNINTSFTLSAGHIDNNGLMLLNGAHTIGIYYGTPGIFNHGTVKKTAGNSGVYNMGVPLKNHSDGQTIVEEGELHVTSDFTNSGSLSVAAGTIFKANRTVIENGASFTGAGTLIVHSNGLIANNSANVHVDIAETEWLSSLNGTGILTFNQHVVWKNANLGGGALSVIIAAGATLDLSTTGAHGIGGTLTNNGTMNANVNFGGGTVNNNGTMNLAPGIDFGGGTMNNVGTMTNNAGGNVTAVYLVNNSGTIVVTDGTFSFNNGLSNAGAISVAAGATAQLNGYANTLETGASITGAGTFNVQSNLSVNADVTLGIATFTLFGGSTSGTGTLTVEHIFNANGYLQSPVVIAAGGTMNVNYVILYNTLTNNGTVNCMANLLIDDGLALIQNNGAFHISEDVVLGSQYGYYNIGTFDNAGTVDKTSAGTVAMNLEFNHLASGSLELQSGILEIGQLDNESNINVAPGATLTVKGGSNLAGGTLSGTGTLRILGSGWHLSSILTINSLTLEIDGDLSGDAGATLEIESAATWFSGNLAVSTNIAASGTLGIPSGGSLSLSAPLSNAGTVNCSTTLNAGADITNAGIINFTDSYAGFFTFGNETLSNTGTINGNASGYSYLNLHTVNTGTLTLNSAYTFLNNGLDNNASITIGQDAIVYLSGISAFNAGSSIAGPGSINSDGELTLAVNFNFSGGMFSINGGALHGPGDLSINSAMTWQYGDIETDITIAAGATLQIGNNYGGGGGSKSSKTLTQNFALHPSNSGFTLYNTITNQGTTTQNSTYFMDGGSFVNNGTIEMENAGINDDNAGGGTFTNNGIWNVQNNFYTDINASNNGTLAGSGNMNFSIELDNNGIVAPGNSIGQLNFSPNYANGSALQIEMQSSDGPGYGHDFVETDGTIALGGTLSVTEIGTPLNGEYVIMHCNGGPDCRTGTFSSTSLPSDYVVSYTGEEVILTKGQPASVSPADTTICSGNPVTLTASAGDTYAWSTGETTQSIEIYPYYAQTYYVTVYDSNGGGSLGSATVNVNQVPYAYINPGYSMVCQGESITLTIYGDGETYLWDSGETTQSITVSPSTEVIYSATVTASGGCTTVVNATVVGSDTPPIVPEITGIPETVCANDYGFYLSNYQDGVSGDWSGSGVYYGYYFDPYGLSGPQLLTFSPYPGQCAVPATWTIEVTSGIFYEDADSDGFGNPNVFETTCTQPSGFVSDNTDCDDQNVASNPGATEICNSVDDDCDGQIDEGVQSTFYADTDGDGFGNAAVSQMACFAPEGFVSDNTDCDDQNAATNPGATEICNGVDDDCDGQIDEGVQSTFYADTDGDGFGNAAVSQMACSAPEGFVSDNTDCDDQNAASNPGATEICNSMDDDCDGQIDEGVQATFYADTDGDGFGDAAVSQMACLAPEGFVSDNTDCDDQNAATNPGATEICNSVDDDCDGQIDEGDICDGDGDGYTIAQGDCNDENANIHPNATEICNNLDDDCDGLVDENVGLTWYADTDADGYGDANVSQTACNQPEGFVSNNNDCNDENGSVHPNATEICNDLDDDCDGFVDETTLNVSLSVGNILCNGGNTTLVASGSGGAAPYQFSLNGEAFGNSGVFSVTAGSQTITVKDAYNCISSNTLDITEPLAILIDPIEITHVVCAGGNTGAVNIIVSGGTGNYSYHWSNNKTTQDLLNVAGNTYTVTVTDANACTTTASATVNSKLKLTLSKTNTICNGGSDGTATASATGGTPDYSYEWSNGETTAIITGLSVGTYTVTISDDLGCTRTGQISVGQPSAIGITGVVTKVTCNGGTDGAIAITISNGVAPFTYVWSDGATTEDRSEIAAGTYTLLVTDSNGCTREKSFSVTQPTALVLSFSVDNVRCNGSADGEITATVSGGVKYPTTNLCNGERYCFDWSNAATSRIISGLGSGIYTVTVTDANGCNIIGSATVTEPALLEITEVLSEPLPNNKFKLTVTANGGTPVYKYRRIPGGGYQSSNVFNNVPAGTYDIVVRDYNLCTDTTTVVLGGSARPENPEDRQESEELLVVNFENPVLAYPNPASERFRLQLGREYQTAHLMIFNAQGQLMLENIFEENADLGTYEVTTWKSGLYLVIVELDGERFAQKVLVTK